MVRDDRYRDSSRDSWVSANFHELACRKRGIFVSFDGRNRDVNVWKMLELFGRRVSRLLDAYFILCNDLCLFRIFRYRYIYIYKYYIGFQLRDKNFFWNYEKQETVNILYWILEDSELMNVRNFFKFIQYVIQCRGFVCV